MPAKVVQDFYKSSEISTERPELRFRGKRLLMMPLSRVFKKFKIIQTKVKIGFSTFKRLRPKSVMQSRRWHSCRCTYCVNAELVMAAINRKLVGKNSTLKIVSVYDLVCKVFCDKPLEANYQRMECIKQECEFCDDWAATLHSHYEPVCNDRATCAMKWS